MSRKRTQPDEEEEEDVVERVTKCPICDEPMTAPLEPRRLPCPGQHAFCSPCLEKCLLAAGPRGPTCPTCRAPARVTAANFRALLPVERVIVNLASAKKPVAKKARGGGGEACAARDCNEGVGHACDTCGARLCDTHAAAHPEAAATKNHLVRSLAAAAAGAGAGAAGGASSPSRVTPACAAHGGLLAFHCPACAMFLCAGECRPLDHFAHGVRPLADVTAVAAAALAQRADATERSAARAGERVAALLAETAARRARHAREKRDLDKMEAFIQRAVRDRAAALAAEQARCDAANDAAIDAALAAATEAKDACVDAATAARAAIARGVPTELVGVRGGEQLASAVDGGSALAAAAARAAEAAAAPMPADTVWAPTVGTRGEWRAVVDGMLRGHKDDRDNEYSLHVVVRGEADLRALLAAHESHLVGGLDTIVRAMRSADTGLLEAAFGAIGKASRLAAHATDRQADAIVSRAAEVLAEHGARGSLGLAAWGACGALHAASARAWGKLRAHAEDAIAASANGARSVVWAVCGVDAAEAAALCVAALKAWPAERIVDAVHNARINARALVGAGVLAVASDLRVPTPCLPALLSNVAQDAAAAPRLCERDTFRRIMAHLLEWSTRDETVASYTVALLCDVVAFDAASMFGVVAASPECLALMHDSLWCPHGWLLRRRVRCVDLLARLACAAPAAAAAVRGSAVLPLLAALGGGRAICAPQPGERLDEVLAALLAAVGAAAAVPEELRRRAADALEPAQFARTIRALAGPGGA